MSFKMTEMNIDTIWTWKRPFDRSYWVVPGLLLAGCYPGSPNPDRALQKCEAMIRCGIRSVVSLMEVGETDWQGQHFSGYEQVLNQAAASAGTTVSLCRHPIRDRSIPSREEMVKILDTLDTAMAQNQPAYVHCWGGKGRTGTVIGCFLARHGHASGERGLELLSRLRRPDPTCLEPSPENELQCSFVRTWPRGE